MLASKISRSLAVLKLGTFYNGVFSQPCRWEMYRSFPFLRAEQKVLIVLKSIIIVFLCNTYKYAPLTKQIIRRRIFLSSFFFKSENNLLPFTLCSLKTFVLKNSSTQTPIHRKLVFSIHLTPEKCNFHCASFLKITVKVFDSRVT